MPLLLLTIFFLVTTGKANALESTIEEDRDIVEYEEPLTTMWCKLNKDVEGRNGCMDDKQCLDNARGQCDKDPHCYGVSWYQNLVGQRIKLCLSRDMAPKNDGWRTMMKSKGCSNKEGDLCGGWSFAGSTCCPEGFRCKQKYGTSNWPTCTLKTEAELQETNCNCINFMNGDYGNCKKDYGNYFSNRKICYVSATACCRDKKWSASAGKHYSWDACNPLSRKTCD